MAKTQNDDQRAVGAGVDGPSIYAIPKVLHSEGLDAYVVRRLGLPFRLGSQFPLTRPPAHRRARRAHPAATGPPGRFLIDRPSPHHSITPPHHHPITMPIPNLTIIGESINDSVPSTHRFFEANDIAGLKELAVTQDLGGASSQPVAADEFDRMDPANVSPWIAYLCSDHATDITGQTFVVLGTLAISADANLGTPPNSFIPDHLWINGGTLRATESFTMAAYRGIYFSSAGGTIEVDATKTLTYPNHLPIPAGTMTKTGGGTLSLPRLNVGTSGSGALLVTGGGTVTTTDPAFANHIAGSPGSTGSGASHDSFRMLARTRPSQTLNVWPSGST